MKQRSALKTINFLTGLALFLLALLPRVYELQRFVTADEAKWVYRSARFLAAFIEGDFAATSVNLTPAVTTTWLGSLGLVGYYQLNRAALNQPFMDWLLSLPEFRTELEVLAATRCSMAIFTSLGGVAIYLLARRLFGWWPAFIAAVFFAFDPHMVALSRVLGHDAPTAIFMTLSVLLLLFALNQPGEQQSTEAREQTRESISPASHHRSAFLVSVIFSGVAAGLAFLSKAPALFLIPFAGLLFLGKVWRNSSSLYFWFKRFVVWAVVAFLAFVVFWPAAWVDPLGRSLAVAENAFLSATDQEEADDEGYWLVPDLGPFYYVVNGAFKLSPLIMIGAGLAFILISHQRRKYGAAPVSSLANLLWLLVFILFFTIFMTFGDKRSARYILPAFPPLFLVAAFGWLWLFRLVGGKLQVIGNPQQTLRSPLSAPRSSVPTPLIIFTLILALSALAVLIPYAPYFYTYYNPLMGGPFTAPQWVKIGWGEGLDQVGRFLQREGDPLSTRVGTPYASTVVPFFEGDLSSVTGSNLDYVVLYSKQVQSGEPSPGFIRYFEYLGPIFSVDLNGIHYADVYPGPALQPALTLTPGLDHAILPKPVGFRPLTPYGRLGETLPVDVLWLADDPLPVAPSTLSLEPITAFDFLNEHNHLDGTPVEARQRTILTEGPGLMTRLAENLVVSRHPLDLPADLPRGVYALLVDGRPLGELDLRHFQIPTALAPLDGLVFGDQIALAAYQFEPTADYIGLTIAWQAQKSRMPDYTVFVQLLDAESNTRQAGVDTQPLGGEWPTSRWVKDEVVVDEYTVAIPPDLPPGFYRIIAGLYQPQTGQRLALSDGRDFWVLPWTYILNEK